MPLNWQEDISNRYTFTSREYNPESEAYYYRFCTYFPTISRLGSRDRKFRINRYAYCASSPVRFRDPFGRQPEECPDLLKQTLQTGVLEDFPNAEEVP